MIVDASVVIAALMADGAVRHALLHTPVALVAPAYIREEVDRHVPAIVKRSGLPEASIREALGQLFARIQLIPSGLDGAALETARAACVKAKAVGDEEYVALAMTTGESIWSLDEDFDRIPGVHRVATADVRKLGEPASP